MKKCLVVKHHIPIPGYGTLTPGEVLNDALICLLDDEQIERLLRREALAVMGDDEEWEDDGEDADNPDEPPVLPEKDALEEPEAPVPTDLENGQEKQGNDDGEAEADEDEAEAETEPPEMDATESIVDAPAPAAPQPHKAGGYKRGKKAGEAK